MKKKGKQELKCVEKVEAASRRCRRNSDLKKHDKILMHLVNNLYVNLIFTT